MIPERYSPTAHALFRIVFGFLFCCHGLQKLFGLFGGLNGQGATPPIGSRFGIAGVLESVLGLLILCGCFTRVAALLACGEMAVAYFTAHQPRGLWPIQNGGELAVLYCFAFLCIAAQGAGAWSVDAIRRTGTGQP